MLSDLTALLLDMGSFFQEFLLSARRFILHLHLLQRLLPLRGDHAVAQVGQFAFRLQRIHKAAILLQKFRIIIQHIHPRVQEAMDPAQ